MFFCVPLLQSSLTLLSNYFILNFEAEVKTLKPWPEYQDLNPWGRSWGQNFGFEASLTSKL